MLKTYQNFMNSFTKRAWSAIFAITIMALLSTMSSGFLAWTSKDDANAINIAGSVRMAIMRINYQLSTGFTDGHNLGSDIFLDNPTAQEHNPSDHAYKLLDNQPYSAHTQEKMVAVIEDMNARLTQLSAYEKNNNYGFSILNDDVIAENLIKLKQSWQQLIPLLLENKPQEFAISSNTFLTQAHHFVASLQTRNEARQNLLQQVQILALVLTLIIMLVGMKELRQKALNPLNQLIKANKEFEQGNLDKRIHLHGYHELNELGHAFNDMAETIATNHTTLAEKIAEKTQHLKQTNDALTLFYEFSQYLTIDDVSVDKLNELIHDFSQLLTGYRFVLCLSKDLSDVSLHKTKTKITINDNGLFKACDSDCAQCPKARTDHTTVYKLQHQDSFYGELLVHYNTVMYEQDDDNNNVTVYTKKKHETEMLNLLVHLISTGLSLHKQRQQRNQLILLEERTTIARELHDSLAQSLSYLKIQFSLLERQLSLTQQHEEHVSVDVSDTSNHTNADTINQKINHIDKTNKVISHIKEGLSSAYLQLRELLITFRLNLNAESFDEALLSAVEEFSHKGSFETHVNNRISSEDLTAQEQINLLQIVRESLSNVHRHAQATHVNLDFMYKQSTHKVNILIADNGVGLDDDYDIKQHHGLIILRERVIQIGGTIEFLDNKPTGTTVKVCFVPKFLQ